jgi:hypothetical protein
MNRRDDLFPSCPRPAGANDPIACLSFAVDAMREAFDLLLAVVPSEAEETDAGARTWYVESAIRRVVQAARVMRQLADESEDSRIASIAERLDVERRAVLARADELLGTRPGPIDAATPTWRCA